MNLFKKSVFPAVVVGLVVAFSLARPSSAQRLLSELPVGSVTYSVLSPEQMKNLVGDSWVLMDGRSISGSDLNHMTGMTHVLDSRGLYLRGKSNGRSDGWQNPDGDLAVGTLQGDQFASHAHGGVAKIWTAFAGNHGDDDRGNRYTNSGYGSTDNSGGNETRPKSMTLNIYIKIN